MPELSTLETDPALLLHGAHSYPGDNVSLIYGDYYLLEAALRYWQLAQGQHATTNPAFTK